MIKIYRGSAAANSLKCLIVLHEKQLDFENIFVDLMKFEQHEPWFLALNAEGQVPVLEHDATILSHASIINEYLEDAFPSAPSLRPRDPAAAARMRVWNKYIDDEVMEAVSMHGWKLMITKFSQSIPPERFDALVERMPLARQQAKWRAARAGFDEAALEHARRIVHDAVERVDAHLGHTPWLAGDSYSLADINFFAIAGFGLPHLFPDLCDPSRFPHLAEWLDRVKARGGVKAALAG